MGVKRTKAYELMTRHSILPELEGILVGDQMLLVRSSRSEGYTYRPAVICRITKTRIMIDHQRYGEVAYARATGYKVGTRSGATLILDTPETRKILDDGAIEFGEAKKKRAISTSKKSKALNHPAWHRMSDKEIDEIIDFMDRCTSK